MKPFNLEKAKAGHSVCTRDGRKARILCFDKKGDAFPIVALVDDNGREEYRTYTAEGNYMTKGDSVADLFMAPAKEGWINVYKLNSGAVYTGSRVYETKQDALERNNNSEIINTIRIEWEE